MVVHPKKTQHKDRKKRRDLNHRSSAMPVLLILVALSAALFPACSRMMEHEGAVVRCFRNRITTTCIDANRRTVTIIDCMTGIDSIVVFGYQAIPETVHDYTGLWLDDVSDYGAPVVIYYSDSKVAIEYKIAGVSDMVDGELVFDDAALLDAETNPKPVVLRKTSKVSGYRVEDSGLHYYRIIVRNDG